MAKHLRLNNWNYFWFQITVISIFWDNTIINSVFDYLVTIRTVAYFMLLISCMILIKRIKVYPNNINRLIFIAFWSYFILSGLFSIDDFIQHGVEGLRIYYQALWFPAFVLFFLNFKELTRRDLQIVLLFFVKCACVWVVCNFIFYFVELPIWKEWRPWFGRISHGYPTSDVISLDIALFVILILDIKISSKRRLLYSLILLLGIASQVSGTGLVVLAMIIIILLFSFSHLSIKLKKNFIYCIISVLFTLSLSVSFLYEREGDLVDAALVVLNDKFLIFTGRQNEIEWNGDTMQFRQEEFEESKNMYVHNIAEKLFGVGYGHVTLKGAYSKGSKDIYVESQYDLNILTIGYVGQFLFLLYLCYPLKLWFNYYRNKILMFWFGAFPIVIMLLSSFSSIPLALTNLEITFAMFYSIVLYPHKETNNNYFLVSL